MAVSPADPKQKYSIHQSAECQACGQHPACDRLLSESIRPRGRNIKIAYDTLRNSLKNYSFTVLLAC